MHLKKISCNQNIFWKDVILTYQLFNTQVPVKSAKEILAKPIFYNDKFKIGNEVFFYKRWWDKNVRFVKDVVDENGEFLSFMKFVEVYRLNINYLDYLSCVQSIKSYLKRENIKLGNTECNEKNKSFTNYINSRKRSKDIL